jgi:hypothetical protein
MPTTPQYKLIHPSMPTKNVYSPIVCMKFVVVSMIFYALATFEGPMLAIKSDTHQCQPKMYIRQSFAI